MWPPAGSFLQLLDSSALGLAHHIQNNIGLQSLTKLFNRGLNLLNLLRGT